MTELNDDQIKVSITYDQDGDDGPGWYAWETEYPEEGFFWFGVEKPTMETMKSICEEYVLTTEE